jgi:hypothetical protein
VIYTIDDGQGHLLEFFIPAGSFEIQGKGDKNKYKYHSPKKSQTDIKADFDFDKCKFEFKVKKVAGIDQINGTSLEIILQAGADIGWEIVELEVKGKKGERLEYKRKPKFQCCPKDPDSTDTTGSDTLRTDQLQILPEFSSYWLQTDCTSPDFCNGFDIDQNGTVNLADFVLLVEN